MAKNDKNPYTMLSADEKAARGFDLPRIVKNAANLRKKVQSLTNNKGGKMWKTAENTRANG